MSKNEVAKREDYTPTTPNPKLSFSDDLKNFDKEMTRLDPSHKPMSDGFEACMSMPTDKMVTYNLQRTQAMINEAFRQYLQLKIDHKEKLKSWLDSDDPADLARYLKHKPEFSREEMATFKSVDSMTRTLMQLSKEHRAAEVKNRYYIHINSFERMIMFIKEVLRQNINNKEILDKIAEQINEGRKKITLDAEIIGE